MLILGCDFHPHYQQIAMAREVTAEMIAERRLQHEGGEAQAFYRSLQSLNIREKIEYMRANPVKRGLVGTPGEWA
jgi:hypothetical protein